MMRLADLSPERRAWLARARWDRIIEKHEGPWDWRWDIEYDGPPEERADFLTLDGYDVLLPVASAEHPKVSALWVLPSEEGRILTIYLKNMQWAEWYPPGPGKTPWAEVGFLAVCERPPEADWYVAILYHEIFLDPDLMPVRLPPWLATDGELSVGD